MTPNDTNMCRTIGGDRYEVSQTKSGRKHTHTQSGAQGPVPETWANPPTARLTPNKTV